MKIYGTNCREINTNTESPLISFLMTDLQEALEAHIKKPKLKQWIAWGYFPGRCIKGENPIWMARRDHLEEFLRLADTTLDDRNRPKEERDDEHEAAIAACVERWTDEFWKRKSYADKLA